MGIMVTYGSYVKKETNLMRSINQIEWFDTAVALLAGLMIVPAVYTFMGTEGMSAGPGLMFVSLPKIFEAMGAAGPVIGTIFFLMVSFAGQMTSFAHDGITGATPLAIIKAGSRSDSIQKILASGDGKTQEATSLLKMFIGSTGGTIGETCAIALLIGAAYLLIRKIISWRIPVCYIAVFAIFILLFGGRGFDLTYLAAELCGGGLLLGAFFMATDYVTSPITPKGQIIFGVLLGLLTGVFRVFGASAEGVSYAIIICNLLVPLIERVTIPVPFGKEGIKDGK